jgi:aryl-alcohol dehydrogenase-like predicted oxidoreductase
MIDRRKFLGMAAGAGASLALTPQLLRAFQQSGGKLIHRAVPSSGEMLPVISFDPQQESDIPGMKEILRAMLDHGAKVIDFPHGGGHEVARTAAAELGVQDKFFWTMPLGIAKPIVGPRLPGLVPKADAAAMRAALEANLVTFKVPRVDLVMLGTTDVSRAVAIVNEMKKEGKVRYIGVQELTPPPYATDEPYARLESIMRNEPIDFIATDYSAGWRGVEERILPLAMERKIGFMAHFAFNRGRLFQRASGTPLPEWAAEFDAKTWAQFFLKYVISHPGVTVVRTGTTKATHMIDNLGGGIGRLPNEAMRKRMAQLVDSLPASVNPLSAASAGRAVGTNAPPAAVNLVPTVALSAAILDRYAGEYRHAPVGTAVTIRRDGEKLLLKIHDSTMEETAFVARSETHFASAKMYTLEFQVDGQGKVTSAIWVQGPQRLPLERK